jgi:nicotinate phosphoribosyltransferase
MNSVLDTDLYKLTMQQAAIKLYPNATALYRFVNRNPGQKITKVMVQNIRSAIQRVRGLSLTSDEADWLNKNCPYLQKWYIDWLKSFRLDPSQVSIHTDGDEMHLRIEGPWSETIYWEVPLLAIITEEIMKAQKPELTAQDRIELGIRAKNKAKELAENGCHFAEFGTRRRFSYEVHDLVLKNLEPGAGGMLLGTSNVHMAMKYGLKPIGTMAHEWVQAISGLVGLRHANKFALEAWNNVYQGDLGIALTDTFGSDAFFRDFDGVHSRLFDGLRQDSGDPIHFMQKAEQFYREMGIDPKTKTIIYSDSLTVGKCCLYQRATEKHFKCAFGVGTHLTNDVEGTTPANIVIKLVQIDDVPVVKLSDDPGKAIGDPAAVSNARWTFGLDR